MGSQILKTKAPSALAKPMAPNYHALVTPVLHRRFVRASWTTLTIAYVGNILMENVSGWPWSAFPLGYAGLNTLILFIFLLPILILRIAQLSTTSRKSISDVHCLVHSLSNYTLLKCISWYALSAWLIIQFYIWNTRSSSDLSIVTKRENYEPYRLNERPLYLLSCALPLGIIQGVIHIWIDRDYLTLKNVDRTILQAFSNSIIRSIQRVGTSIIASVAATPVFYAVFRRVICGVSHSAVGSFLKIHPDIQPQTLSNKIDLLFRSVWLAMLIIIAWEATNISFTLEFEKGPIRDGKTISDMSPDPNGSLVLGLKLKKKPFSRLMAFKELAFIATEMPSRRESVFKDLTKPTPILELIMTECRGLLNVVITDLSPPPELSTGPVEAKCPSPIKDIKGFSPQKPSDENVLRTPRKQTIVDQWQATPGNMPTSPINLNALKTHMIKKETVESKIYDLLNPILQSQYGDILRLTIQRKTTSLLPNAAMQIDALDAMVGFICASLKEDTYGMIQKDISGILEEFTKIASTLEAYMAKPPLHWTDMHAKRVMEQGSAAAKEALFPEAVVLLAAINGGLQKIGDVFTPYFDGIGLSVDVKRKIRRVCEAAKATKL